MTATLKGAVYNEIDEYAAAWLRNLIAKGHIADGEVDTRSIVDVRPDDYRGFVQCHFFAGIGGWSIALRRGGGADDRPVWTGSCPCGPFSNAGEMERFSDERHLWPDWVRLIKERKPPVIFGEQVASATEWLRLVRGDLEALDYAVGAAPIEAASAGADHLRDRFWFVADAESISGGTGLRKTGTVEDRPVPAAIVGRDSKDIPLVDCVGARLEGHSRHGHGRTGWPLPAGSAAAAGADVGSDRPLPDADIEHANRAGYGAGADRRQQSEPPGILGGDDRYQWVVGIDGKQRRLKSGVRLLADGVSSRVGKLRAIGNAIDPRPASEFIAAYLECRP